MPKTFKKQFGDKKRSKYFCIDEEGETVWLTDHDGDMMLDFIARHKSEPFFLYWSPSAIHSSNIETPDRLTDRTQAQGKRRALAGAIVSVDDQVGKLLDFLEKHGLRDNTLIIFSSDNGPNLGEEGSAAPYTGGKGGGTQKEGWVRAPTIYSFPGKIPEGTKYHGLNATFDFYSTIASAIGQAIPKHCDGVDLLPYLRGDKKGDAHKFIYWLNSQEDDAVRRHLVAARWKDWRLYKKYAEDTWQLFDLKADPREEKDMATQYPEIVEDMSKHHKAWTKTLAPHGQINKELKADPLPKGYGWVISEGK